MMTSNLKNILNLQLNDTENLVDYFADHPRYSFIDTAANIRQQLVKTPLQSAIANSDLLVQHIFKFEHAWDMEKCPEPIQMAKEINWQQNYQGDPEWMYMLNRHNYLIDLIYAYFATDKQTYLDCYLDLLSQWLNSEPTENTRENSTWRTLDTGIRLKNWIKQFELLLPFKLIPEELLARIIISVNRQVAYLLEKMPYDNSRLLSNWRILEFHGAYIAATFFPEIKNAPQWQVIAKKRLTECLEIQITNDGFHWEQSLMYHHEVLLNAVEALQCGQHQRDDFPEEYPIILQKMLQATTHAILPNQQQPCTGDSDSESLSELITLAALILQPAHLPSLGILKKPNLSLILAYGTECATDLKNLHQQLQKVDQLDFKHEDVGNYYIRTSWQPQASYLFFKNGFLGGGHGHNDLLHFDLAINGEPILVDSGRYTYLESNPLRQALKESRHHNTITMDNQEYSIQEGSWNNKTVANEVKRPVRINQPVCLLQGQHLGYFPDAVINRKIIFIKEINLTIISDEMMSTTIHHFEEHFFFNEHRLTIDKHGINYRSDNNFINIYPVSQQVISCQEAQISPAYNSLRTTQSLVLSKQLNHNDALTTIIADGRHYPITWQELPIFDMNHQQASSASITGLKISQGNATYLVAINHFEPQGDSRHLYEIDSVPFFGKTVVIKQQTDQLFKQVLEY